MVQPFQTVTNALEKKRGASASSALGYAAKTLSQQANSGSSQLYAQHLASHTSAIQGLSEASQELKKSTAEQNKVLMRLLETTEPKKADELPRETKKTEIPPGCWRSPARDEKADKTYRAG